MSFTLTSLCSQPVNTNLALTHCQVPSLHDGYRHLWSLVKELAPLLPTAVEEYGRQRQLAWSLARHLVATTLSPDAHAGSVRQLRWHQQHDEDVQHDCDCEHSNTSWLPYVLAALHIQEHGVLQAAERERTSTRLAAASGVLVAYDPATACHPFGPLGCGPRVLGVYLSDDDLSASPLVHLARHLMQQQQQGQAAGCSTSMSVNVSAVGAFTAPGNRLGAGLGWGTSR